MSRAVDDEYEIEVHPNQVLVFAKNWKGGYGLVAELDPSQTLQEMAQEVYEILASANKPVRFVEDI